MRLRSRALAVALAAGVLSISSGVTAAAHADDGTITGGDVSAPGDQVDPDVQAQSDAKAAGAAEWWTYSAANPYTGASALALSATALIAPTSQQKYLNVKYYDQNKSYYCGPASGKMILKRLGAGRSAWNNATQVQNHIGGAAHMRTEINKVTTWDSGRFRIGLNRWLSDSNEGWYVDEDTPSPAFFKNALRIDVQTWDHPFGADTVELPYSAHYNHHPRSQKIGHWLTVSAYRDYGDTTRFLDPATSVWPEASQAFNASTNSFVNTYLQYNGITW